MDKDKKASGSGKKKKVEDKKDKKKAEDKKDGCRASGAAGGRMEDELAAAFAALTLSPEGLVDPLKCMPMIARAKFNGLETLEQKAQLVQITSIRFENWLKQKHQDENCQRLPTGSSEEEDSKTPVVARKKCLSVPPPGRREIRPVDTSRAVLSFFLEGSLNPPRIPSSILGHLNMGNRFSRFSFPSYARRGPSLSQFGLAFVNNRRSSNSVEENNGEGDGVATVTEDYSDEEVFVDDLSKSLE